ncbi:unnamed protein product [Pleuronectes platessa]|uniref:Uncharacterized protein n=1 Tax=Pleuronectes platessa TaxID=8262 RepID=A0A9N7V4U7_PLEPL|nr:unnamed protein product [Pleuronectes platessa]
MKGAAAGGQTLVSARASGLPCRCWRISSRDLSPALAGPRRAHFLRGGSPRPALGRLGKAGGGRNEDHAEKGFTKASACWGDEGGPKPACVSPSRGDTGVSE